MAYVDHAFSISDEDIMMEPSYVIHNKPPIKEIALAVSLLVFGSLGIVIGSLMAYNHVGGDSTHGTNSFPFRDLGSDCEFPRRYSLPGWDRSEIFVKMSLNL